MTDWYFDSAAQARLRQQTILIFYHEQIMETNRYFGMIQNLLTIFHFSTPSFIDDCGGFTSEEERIHRTVNNLDELINNQNSAVCLVINGDDLGEDLIFFQ